MRETLEKYFKGERTLYFTPNDAHLAIEGNTYLRYELKGMVYLWFGGDSGEVCILATHSHSKLDTIISELIY